MRIERQKLQTFSQWKKQWGSTYKEEDFPLTFKVSSGWINDEWRSITFETEEFRLSEKFDRGTFDDVSMSIINLHKKLVSMAIIIDSDFNYVIDWDEVGDACEEPKMLYWAGSIGRFELETPPLTPKSPKSKYNHPKD